MRSTARSTLLDAARAGSVAECRVLLEEGAAIDARDCDGWTALHCTASVDVATLLIDSGVDLDARTSEPYRGRVNGVAISLPAGATPLDVAVAFGRQTLAPRMEQRGGRRIVTAERTGAELAFVHALLKRDHAEAARLLSMHGETKVRSPDLAPPLHEAITAHDPALAIALVDAGHSLTALDDDGQSAWLLAIRFHELALARALLDRGADPLARTAAGGTALHGAPVEAIPFLLEAGIPIDARDGAGRTALHAATSAAHVQTLIAAGATLTAIDHGGLTALDLTLHELRRPFAIAGALLDAGAMLKNVDAPHGPRSGLSPVSLRLMAQDDRAAREFLMQLLDHGLPPDAADMRGWTALHEAAYRRDGDLIERLRAAGARTDLPSTRPVRTYAAGTTAEEVARARGQSIER